MTELETRRSRASNYLVKNAKDDAVSKAGISADLQLLRNELAMENERLGGGKFNYLNQLNIDDYNQEVLDSTKAFIEQLKKYYNEQVNIGNKVKGKILDNLSSTPEKEKAFNRLRDQNANEKIRSMVLNVLTPVRIVEGKGRLIQKTDPIYTDPDPSHFLDFKANFYSPRKHFAGYTFDTFWFNITVIWLMSIFLLIALYFEWLYKLVLGIDLIFKRMKKGGQYVKQRKW